MKAQRWLTEGFALGVDDRVIFEAVESSEPVQCWLAQFDPEERPCTHRIERFHFISRQRVRGYLIGGGLWVDDGYEYYFEDDLVPQAEWDPRNGGIACEGHHRRFDSHATPRIEVPALSLPSHVLDFIADYGLEQEAERKFPGFEFHCAQELPA